MLVVLWRLLAWPAAARPKADFRRYKTFAHKVAESAGLEKGFTAISCRASMNVMQAMFGTPDEPAFPAVEGIEAGKIINLSHLKLAAGPVGSDEQGNPRGLYREHCAHCHGITGDGAGRRPRFSIRIRATIAKGSSNSNRRPSARSRRTPT